MRTFDQKPALWAEIIVPRATILSPRDIIFARGRLFWPTGGNFVPRAKDDKHYCACVSTLSGLFCDMDSLSALCIIELDVASVTVSSRVIQLSCGCLLTVRRPSHGCLSRVLRRAGCNARHLVGCRTTSCMLQD